MATAMAEAFSRAEVLAFAQQYRQQQTQTANEKRAAMGITLLPGSREVGTREQHLVSSDVPTHAHLPAALAARLRTGCFREDTYVGTYTILVTRSEPRPSAFGGHKRPDAWWPVLSPSWALVHSQWGGIGLRPQMPWPLFVRCYWAQLQALSPQTQNSYIARLGQLLKKYPSVTLLTAEASRGQAESTLYTQRHILQTWLLDKPLPAAY